MDWSTHFTCALHVLMILSEGRRSVVEGTSEEGVSESGREKVSS